MSLNDLAGTLFKGFSKLNRKERFHRLIEMGAITTEDMHYLETSSGLTCDLAEKFIENVIGYFPLPLGVATNFRIDNQDYIIPMAVEETSIIAALSKTAKWIRHSGTLTTHVQGDCSIGQIQIAHLKNQEHFNRTIEANKNFLIEKANQHVTHGLVKRGGGVCDLKIRYLDHPQGGTMAVLHVLVDCCDAMGANIVNQTLEYLKPWIEQISDETVTMCILSNLNDDRLACAKLIIQDIDDTLGHRLEEASWFADTDPYRAATHNKGILNGIDPILIATGNDWRAVEACVHAYASRGDHYQAITQWRMHGRDLVGTFKAPLPVGTVGGMTRLHPTAHLCMRMLGVKDAKHLARILAAVGLVQNLGAIRALSTEGIIKGHMKLHIDNLTLNTDAAPEELPLLKQRLEEWLRTHKRVSESIAIQLLKELRQTWRTNLQRQKSTTS